MAMNWAEARGEIWRANLEGMEATLAPIDAPLIDALRLDAPYRIADLACGGGGTTLELWRRSPAGCSVHGFDIARGLVETARRRVPAGADAIVRFEEADLSVAAPSGGPFDRVSSRFGMMFFEDPPAAFRNLAQWLAPGGRFAFAVWSKPADNPLTAIARDAVASFIDLPAPIPDTPGPFRYGDVAKLVALLRAAGFDGIETAEWRGKLAVGGGLAPPAAADFALAAFSVAEPVAHTSDEVRAQIRRNLSDAYAQHLEEGVVRVPAAVHIVTGTR